MTTTSTDTADQPQGMAAAGPPETPGITVNGSRAGLDGATPHTTLLDWLRARGWTGTKEGCAEGECGACAVMVARPSPDAPGTTEWTALNSCLVPVAALDGQEVVTAEGLGAPGALHPVQREMAERGGSQCGYCTPGFVCSMAAEFYRPARCSGEAPVDHEHGANGFDLHALSGNLCRCTGYRPIRDAAFALGRPEDGDALVARQREAAPAPRPTRLVADGASFLRPTDLAEAVGLLAAHEDALLLAGSTDVGVELNLRGRRPSLLVAVDRIPQMRELEIGAEEIRVGAALTLTEVERGLAGRVPLLDRLFPQFASRLIRNAATLGGNLGTASPIGDSPPVLLALEASLVLAGAEGERVVPLADYFTGCRQSVRGRTELIREIRIPLPLATTTELHKIAKRRFDDISSVAVAYALDLRDGQVARARIGLGGVAATPLRALAAEAALEGRPWDAATVRAAADVLRSEGTPMSDHRASARYRSEMLAQSLLKLHAQTTEEARS